ncbi:MAG: Fur family transcriptional regulator [Candidatus Hermodarchaeota archaeon]
MTLTDDQLISILRDGGYKVTPQRLAICDYVLSSKEHPTVEQIHSKILKKHPTISLNTIYQTMDMLNDLGLVQEMRFGSGSSRFDPNTSLHANIICQNCGKIRDFESESIRELWARVVTEMDVEPLGQRLDIYVLCDECRR